MYHGLVRPARFEIIAFVFWESAHVQQPGVIADVRPAVWVGFSLVVKARPRERPGHEGSRHHGQPSLFGQVITTAPPVCRVVNILATRGLIIGVLAAEHRFVWMNLMDAVKGSVVVIDTDNVLDVRNPRQAPTPKSAGLAPVLHPVADIV